MLIQKKINEVLSRIRPRRKTDKESWQILGMRWRVIGPPFVYALYFSNNVYRLKTSNWKSNFWNFLFYYIYILWEALRILYDEISTWFIVRHFAPTKFVLKTCAYKVFHLRRATPCISHLIDIEKMLSFISGWYMAEEEKDI